MSAMTSALAPPLSPARVSAMSPGTMDSRMKLNTTTASSSPAALRSRWAMTVTNPMMRPSPA